MSDVIIELPRYQCHRQVWALKIKLVIPNPRGVELHFENERYCPFEMTEEWAIRHQPHPGGYLVVYEDGYRSYSPGREFENGYTLLDGSASANASSTRPSIEPQPMRLTADNHDALLKLKELFDHAPSMPIIPAPAEQGALSKIVAAEVVKAPRVTPQRIEDVIAEEHYFTGNAALDAARFRWLIEDHRNPNERQCARETAERIGVLGDGGARIAVDVAMGRDINAWNQQALGLLTFCVLVLKNGFTVTGESACASPENFDPELGRKIARENAVNKVWMLEGYLLKQKLHDEAEKDALVASLGEDDCEGCKI